MDERFINLRRKLDLLGYRQNLNYDSVALVDNLLSDLLQTSDQLKNISICRDTPTIPKRTSQRSAEDHHHHNLIHQCNHQATINKLIKENTDLNRQILKIKDQKDQESKIVKSQLRKLEGENEDLLFLNGQYLLKIQKLEKESQLKTEKLQQLQERTQQTIIQTSGAKKTFSFRHQRMDMDALVPQSSDSRSKTKPTVDLALLEENYADLFKAAEQQANKLKSELDTFKLANEQAEEIISNLNRQIEAKNAENERLSNLIAEVDRSCSCAHISSSHQACGDHLVAHLNLEINNLHRLNQDLEKELKEAINAGREAQIKSSNLTNQNKQLENELTDVDKVAQAVLKQKEELVHAADAEMKTAKDELEKLYGVIEKLEKEVNTVTKERDSLLKEKDEMAKTKELYQSNISETINRLQSDKKDLEDRLNRALSNEADLLTRIEQLGRRLGPTKTQNDGGETYLNRVLKTIESQRDFYKDQLEKVIRRLQDDTDQQQPPSTSTPLSKPGIQHFHIDPLCRLLEEERDLYKNEYLKIREGAPSVLQTSRQISDLQRKFQKVTEEKNELNKTLETLEKHIEEANTNLRRVTEEKNRLQVLVDNNLQVPVGQGRRSTSPTISSLYQAERDRDKFKADLQLANAELDDVRNRLKLATETQIAERRRLENRISNLENENLMGNAERAELLSKNTTYKAMMSSMEDQLNALQRRLVEVQNEAFQDKSNYNMLRSQVDQTEKSLKDAQRLLSNKVTEREKTEMQAQDYIRRINELEDVVRRRNEEIANSKKSILALDQGKDNLQMELDSRVEKLVSVQQELSMASKDISGLRSTIMNLELRIDRLMDEIVTKDRDNKALYKQLESEKANSQEIQRNHDQILKQNQQLRDDMLVMTRENQALERDLHIALGEQERLRRQIQDYVVEVTRIEELLREKEQERSNLLEQFTHLTSSTSDLKCHRALLESEAGDIRMQLLAKNTELKHSQDAFNLLSQEMQEHINREQTRDYQFLSFQRNLSSLEDQLAERQRECEELRRDVTATRDLCVKLDSIKDRLTGELKQKDISIEKMEMRIRELEQDVDALRAQVSSEKAAVENLEQLLAANRQKEFQTARENRKLIDELESLKERLAAAESKVLQQLQIATRFQNEASNLEMEMEHLKRQLSNEKFERERLHQELKRFKQMSPGIAGSTSISPDHWRHNIGSVNVVAGGEKSVTTTSEYQHRISRTVESEARVSPPLLSHRNIILKGPSNS